MHITFQNQLPTSNYQDLQNMWHVTVEKRPYAAISKLLSLTLSTVVAKLSPAIEKN